MLNKDCLFLIFNYCFDNFTEFTNMRLVSKDFLEVSTMVWFQPIQKIFPPSTFINTEKCIVCVKSPTRHKTVPYGQYPRAMYIYCDKFECSRSVIRNMVENAKIQNISILLHEAVQENGFCPRSNGCFTKCKFMRGWMWTSKHIRCVMGNLIKDVHLDNIDKKYRLQYKILKL